MEKMNDTTTASARWAGRTWNIVTADEELSDDLLSTGVPAQFELEPNPGQPSTFTIKPSGKSALPPLLQNVILTLKGTEAPACFANNMRLPSYSETTKELYEDASDQLVSDADGRDVVRLEGSQSGGNAVITIYEAPGVIETDGNCGEALVVICVADPATDADGTAIGWN